MSEVITENHPDVWKPGSSFLRRGFEESCHLLFIWDCLSCAQVRLKYYMNLTSNFYCGSFHYLTFAFTYFLQSYSLNSAHKCCCGSVLVECSTTNKAHWKSMLESNELNFPEDDKNSHELNIEVN